jgi:hypothetical protein
MMLSWVQTAALMGPVIAWEAIWWHQRLRSRRTMYGEALRLARHIGRPLAVIGAADRGVTGGYGYGDFTVDIDPNCNCPNFVWADITKRIPFRDNSVVCFVSCVLEYVSDYEAAMRELLRVSGGNLVVVRVQPWTLVAYLYPGCRRTIPKSPLGTHGSDGQVSTSKKGEVPWLSPS